MSTSPTVEVRNISKSYGSTLAVDSLSFSAFRGEVFGLLGPNGAGKTTTLEMIEGLRQPDAGEIFINGMNVRTDLAKVKEVIGVQLQATSLYDKIKVGEALSLYGGYYRKQRSTTELLELVALEDKRNDYHKNLSGGHKQRLALALTLVNDPQVVFLDEPTTGLDPQARRNLWDIINVMRSDDKTVILTTHYMEEAEQLCDRIAIMDHGKVIAEGTTGKLIEEMKVDNCIEFQEIAELPADLLSALPAVTRVQQRGGNVEVFSKHPQSTLVGLLETAENKQVNINDLHIRRPTLEDVFLELTGRRLRE